MCVSKGLWLGAILSALSLNPVWAKSCPEINDFEGLIFDAGSFPASKGMEGYLDKALLLSVEKAVLFPHPDATKGNTPKELEAIFPDLVVQGTKPWSNSPSVIWPEPLSRENVGHLEAELERHSDRIYLLSNPLRFDLAYISRLMKNYKNLWVGYGVNEIKALLSSCGEGDLSHLMQVAQGRFVFTSFGQNTGWETYKKTIQKLKKLSLILPANQANGLLYQNAEELYNLAVNAP